MAIISSGKAGKALVLRLPIYIYVYDFQDNGDSFLYTGSGGRDLSGNKRTAEQSCDQTLTRMNKYENEWQL